MEAPPGKERGHWLSAGMAECCSLLCFPGFSPKPSGALLQRCVRREGGKLEKPGQWGCDSRAPQACTELVPALTTLSPFLGSPRAGPCPCSRQAGKAWRLLRALSIPWWNHSHGKLPCTGHSLPCSAPQLFPPCCTSCTSCPSSATHLPWQTLPASLGFPHPP